MNTPNARQAIEAIKEDTANIRSRIVKHVVPLLGGPEVPNRKQEPGLNFLESVSPQEIVDLDPNLLKKRLKTLEEQEFISNDTTRNVICSFKKFCSFLIEMEWAIPHRKNDKKTTVSFARKFPKQRLREKPLRPPYALGACVGDYFNPVLEQQIKGFSKFLIETLGKKSITNEIQQTKRLLGLLTEYKTSEPRANRNPQKVIAVVRLGTFPMNELRMEHLVSFVKLILDKEAYPNRQDRRDAEEDAYEEATRAAQKMVNNIKKILDIWSDVPKTRLNLLFIFLNIAKFLYQEERKVDSRKGYDLEYKGIPAVEEIRKLINENGKQVKKQEPAIPKGKKTIPWHEVDENTPDIYDVLLHLKTLADTERRNRCRKECIGTKRSTAVIAGSYQRFLLYAFFCVMPPARQQIIRSLIIGESFVLGQIIGKEVIDARQMADPAKAQWVIGMRNGKTFDTYGFNPYYLPNHQFPDETFLYDYIDKWVHEYRSTLAPKTNHLFFGLKSKESLTAISVYQTVRAATEGFTGKSVNPHEMRRLFNSYIENLHVAPQLKTNMRNRQMAQSDKIAKEVYTTPDAEKIDAPMNKFFQDMISKKGKTNLTIPDLPPRGLNVVDLWAAMTPEQKSAFLKDKA
jgi:CRISPR/Cas system-associated endonuclease Cas3-HD